MVPLSLGSIVAAVVLGVILAALATARLTRLVVEDELTGPLRERIARRNPQGKLAYLVHCRWCAGMWCSLAVVSCFLGTVAAVAAGSPLAWPLAAFVLVPAVAYLALALQTWWEG